MRDLTNLKQTNSTTYLWLGLKPFAKAMCIQQKIVERVRSTGVAEILGVEHPAVITLGHRAIESEETLATTTIPTMKIERGGLATLHSPGQLVIYPILPLRTLGLGVKTYLEVVSYATCQFFKNLGVNCEYSEITPGFFTGHGKIGFLGIRVKQGVSFHGLSLNISNDLSLFSQIRACGSKDLMLDSLENQLKTQVPPLETLFEQWCTQFQLHLTRHCF